MLDRNTNSGKRLPGLARTATGLGYVLSYHLINVFARVPPGTFNLSDRGEAVCEPLWLVLSA